MNRKFCTLKKSFECRGHTKNIQNKNKSNDTLLYISPLFVLLRVSWHFLVITLVYFLDCYQYCNSIASQFGINKVPPAISLTLIDIMRQQPAGTTLTSKHNDFYVLLLPHRGGPRSHGPNLPSGHSLWCWNALMCLAHGGGGVGKP